MRGPSWLTAWRRGSKPLEATPEDATEMQDSSLVDGSGGQTDARMLFAARFLRMFGFGGVTVVLLLLLPAVGLEGEQTGLLLLLILAGDLFVSLLLTTNADRFGRRRTLILGGLLALGSAAVFGSQTSFTLLLVAGVIGVISPAGGEIGPFLAVEQAVLADLSEGNGGVAAVAASFGRYQCCGELAKALGMLAGGYAVDAALARGWDNLTALRLPMLIFGGCALGKVALYCRLSHHVEPSVRMPTAVPSAGGCLALLARPRQLCSSLTGLRSSSSRVVAQLCALFALDAFGGGFIITPFVALWFSRRWGLSFAALGGLLSAVSVVAGLSGMLAGPLVRRLGAVQTMVLTHLPSNVLLIAVPLMPTKEAAAGMLVLRGCISQMDVPARQAYVATLVPPDERSAAGGVTSVARTFGLMASPMFLGACMVAPVSSALFSAPFWIGGGLKVVYDLIVWRHFVAATAGKERGWEPPDVPTRGVTPLEDDDDEEL